jgi:hypothetical protein
MTRLPLYYRENEETKRIGSVVLLDDSNIVVTNQYIVLDAQKPYLVALDGHNEDLRVVVRADPVTVGLDLPPYFFRIALSEH